jgi:hypothetical protein
LPGNSQVPTAHRRMIHDDVTVRRATYDPHD